MKHKILIVDDDEFIRKLYSEELVGSGFEVVLAVDGEDGLSKARTEKPDLVLLDIIMPKKNGFEVLAGLKADPETQNTPVIVFSQLAQDEDKQKAKELGAATYLVKDEIQAGQVTGLVTKLLPSQK